MFESYPSRAKRYIKAQIQKAFPQLNLTELDALDIIIEGKADRSCDFPLLVAAWKSPNQKDMGILLAQATSTAKATSFIHLSFQQADNSVQLTISIAEDSHTLPLKEALSKADQEFNIGNNTIALQGEQGSVSISIAGPDTTFEKLVDEATFDSISKEGSIFLTCSVTPDNIKDIASAEELLYYFTFSSYSLTLE